MLNEVINIKYICKATEVKLKSYIIEMIFKTE